MLGYVVVGYVKLVRVFCYFAVFVDDWGLKMMLGYVVVGYVKSVCGFVLPFLLRMGV